MTDLRLLHVTPSMCPRFGGLVPAVVQMLLADQAAGRTTSLVATRGPGDALGEKFAFIDVRTFNLGRLLGRLSGSPRQVHWLAASVRTFDIVIVHSMFHVGAVVAGVFARASGKRLIIRPHGSLDEYDVQKHKVVKWLLSPLWRFILSGSTEVWCTAERERQSLITFGATPKTRVLPLSVENPQVFGQKGPQPKAETVGDPRRVVLFLGRIDPKKGLERLLAAWAQLPDLSATLVLAGRGEKEYESRIADLVARCQDTNPVIIFGWADSATRAHLLGRASLFVLPSDNENFGIAVVEAMLSGCPVLVSDGVYIAEELWGAGAAFECGRDVESVRAGMSEALTNEQHRVLIAERGRQFAEIAYSQDNMAEQYASLLAEFTHPSPGGISSR